MGSQTKDRAKTTPAVMCIKILLHVFNLIYLIIGASVLGIGIWIQAQLKQFMELTELYYENSPWIMIGVGVLITLVALAGFCCTAKDKVALLYMYGIFIILLAILQMAAGIAGAVFSKTIDTDLTTGLQHTIQMEKYRTTWDKVQEVFKCCGVDSSEDWINTTLGHIPSSCHSSKSSGGTTVAATTPPAPISQLTTTTPASPTGSTAEPITTNAPEPAASTSTETPVSTTATPESTVTLETAATVNTAGRKRRQVTNAPEKGYFPQGCHEKIKGQVQEYMSIIIGVCVGFVLLQVIGAILACVLAKKTSKNNYEQIY